MHLPDPANVNRFPYQRNRPRIPTVFRRLRQAAIVGMGLVLGLGVAPSAAQEETAIPRPDPDQIPIAYLDPMDGPFGKVGQAMHQAFGFSVGEANRQRIQEDQAPFQVIALDNRLSPARSGSLVRRLHGAGIRIIVTGLGSAVFEAVSEAALQHNQSDPDPEQHLLVLGLHASYAQMHGCHRWAFRFAPPPQILMHALIEAARETQPAAWYLVGSQTLVDQSLAGQAARMVAPKKSKKKDSKDSPPALAGQLLLQADQHDSLKRRLARTFDLKQAEGRIHILSTLWGDPLGALMNALPSSGKRAQFRVDALYGLVHPLAPALDKKSPGRVAAAHIGAYAEPDTVFRSLLTRFREEHPQTPRTNLELNSAVLDIPRILSELIGEDRDLDADRLARELSGHRFTSVTGERVTIDRATHLALYPVQVSQLVQRAGGLNLGRAGHDLEPLHRFQPEAESFGLCTIPRPDR